MWVSAGTLAFAGVDVGAPRIGVLPSPWWLAAALIVAALTVAIPRATSRRPTALWLAALLLLPWLPIRVAPAFMVWAGPLRIWLFALIAGAVLVPDVAAGGASRTFRRLSRTRDSRRASRSRSRQRSICSPRGGLRRQIPGGDEPHYLVIAQSLLRDGDIKIENNHLRGDYHTFFFGPLKPDYLRRGTNGEIYSIHAPGLAGVHRPGVRAWWLSRRRGLSGARQRLRDRARVGGRVARHS